MAGRWFLSRHLDVASGNNPKAAATLAKTVPSAGLSPAPHSCSLLNTGWFRPEYPDLEHNTGCGKLPGSTMNHYTHQWSTKRKKWS